MRHVPKIQSLNKKSQWNFHIWSPMHPFQDCCMSTLYVNGAQWEHSKINLAVRNSSINLSRPSISFPPFYDWILSRSCRIIRQGGIRGQFKPKTFPLQSNLTIYNIYKNFPFSFKYFTSRCTRTVDQTTPNKPLSIKFIDCKSKIKIHFYKNTNNLNLILIFLLSDSFESV